jgi:transcription termination factor Rho
LRKTDLARSRSSMNLTELKKRPISDLVKLAETMGLENMGRSRKQDIIFGVLKAHARKGEDIYGDGVLEILQDGFGFLRSSDSSYLAGPDDIYVSPQPDPPLQSAHRRFDLRIDPSAEGRRALLRAAQGRRDQFRLAGELARQGAVRESDAAASDRALKLERGNGSTEDLTARAIDLVAPIGKGQRGLIVSPPKAGKTMLLQNIATAITANHPECYLIVLLIDERPEEVTEMARTVKGEVVSSTFDEPASRHVQVAEMVIEKAKRLVEHKKDVVILLDSITRLARAYNTVVPSSGKVLTGGVDANALQRPKRFFGAARNIEEGGSLTILATALVDTGSKMDDVIFEEFKGTGNSEIHLDRRIAEKRTFPSININRSGTRKEELITDPAELSKMWILRKLLHPMDELAAIEFLLDKMKDTKTNTDFFDAMKRLQYGDQLFLIDDPVHSEFDWRQVDITYTYSFLRTERFELGAGLGIDLLQAEAIAEIPRTQQYADFNGAGPFATLALDGTWLIAKHWSFNARGQYLKISVGSVSGMMGDYHADFQYRWKRNVAFGLGYEYQDAELDVRNDNPSGVLRLSFSGPQLFGRVSF